MSDINISIVLYNNSYSEILALVDRAIRVSRIRTIFLIDNSEMRSVNFADIDKVVYVFNNNNIGFGAAHNIALQESVKQGVKYHVIVNPDIYVGHSVLEELSVFMDKNIDVGLIMPKILYPNGDEQHLCKLLPRPSDLFVRRFLTYTKYAKKLIFRYELREMKDEIQYDIPALSGCFMFFRLTTLETIGFFDTRYFMYMEDVDLCRRVHKVAKTVYYPNVSIIHAYGKGSYHNFKLMRYHILSAIKYFNKWGWFIDTERKQINNKILKLTNE